ncbi:hypothetical protein JB92DRAFT_3110110 [Gautieria morchelliformis]|nr:hypothetical protein JB92DRAFT_3110110 [Gautieria morchelliformis]
MAPVTKRKALPEINLTQPPTCSMVPKKSSTHNESSSRTCPLLGPAPTETITTNPSSRTRLAEKGLECQIQVEADKQQLACQREHHLAREEQARAQEALKVDVAALRDEGLGDEEIDEFLNDPNANDSEDEPDPQPRSRQTRSIIHIILFYFIFIVNALTLSSLHSRASFHPIPEATIALVFTAVEYAVYQWTSGIHVKGSNFTEVKYAKVYRQHLSGLEVWHTYSERSGQALARHQQRLHDHGRAHAGFPNIVTNPQKPAFNAAKFTPATQALDDNEHSDG